MDRTAWQRPGPVRPDEHDMVVFPDFGKCDSRLDQGGGLMLWHLEWLCGRLVWVQPVLRLLDNRAALGYAHHISLF